MAVEIKPCYVYHNDGKATPWTVDVSGLPAVQRVAVRSYNGEPVKISFHRSGKRVFPVNDELYLHPGFTGAAEVFDVRAVDFDAIVMDLDPEGSSTGAEVTLILEV